TLRTAKAPLLVLAALLCLLGTARIARAQNVKYTEGTADASLRGSAQVDPSTLGMTLQIPLGGYAGRAGLNTPVTLSYSSKLWRVNTNAGFPGYIDYQRSRTPCTRSIRSRAGPAAWSRRRSSTSAGHKPTTMTRAKRC